MVLTVLFVALQGCSESDSTVVAGGSPPPGVAPPAAPPPGQVEVCNGDWGGIMPAAGWLRSGIDRAACEAGLAGFKNDMKDLSVGTNGTSGGCTCRLVEGSINGAVPLGEGHLGMSVSDSSWLVRDPSRDLASKGDWVAFRPSSEDSTLRSSFEVQLGGATVHPLMATFHARDGVVVLIKANFQKENCVEMSTAMNAAAGPPRTTEEVNKLGPATQLTWLQDGGRAYRVTLWEGKHRGCEWLAFASDAN